MPVTDTLQKIRDYASSLSGEDRKNFISKFNSIKDDDAKIEKLAARISSISKPAPQFSSIAEANAAMNQARREQAAAEYGASGVVPYLRAMDKTAELAAPMLLGGGSAMQAGRVLGQGLSGVLKSGAIGGAVSGAATPAETLQQRASNVALQSAAGAGLGAVGAGAAKVVRGLGDAIRMLPTRISGYRGTDRSADFASKIREAYVGVKADAVKKFGAGLDDLVKANPDKKINLFDEGDIGSILTDPNLPSEASNVFKRTPILRDILSGKRGPDVTVTEAQEIINYIGAKVPRTIKANTMDIPELVSELRAAQASKFPEMSKLREEYARVANPYRDLKSQMRFNNILKSIDQNFGGSEGMKSLRVLFKDNPELLRKMGGYKKAETLLKGAAVAGAYAVGKTALDAVSGSIGMANK